MRSITLLSLLNFFFLSAFGQINEDSLYVFIGEKIEVKKFPQPEEIHLPDTIIINGKPVISQIVSGKLLTRYIAKYKIVHEVYGKLKCDTVEFFAYDHYGMPQFSKYKNVMLYIYKENGKLIHQRYLFHDVYKTKTGEWASSYKVDLYNHILNKNTVIKPTPIDFLEPLVYDTKPYIDKDKLYKYPTPYYTIEGEKATAIWGNYIEELFVLTKSGVLKAKGILY